MKKRWAWEGYVLWSRPKLCKILLYQWHTLCCLSKLKKLPYLYCIYCSFADKIYCLTGLNIFIFFKVHILFELFELVQKNMQKKLIHILLENSFILRANVETKELTCHIATFSASQIKVKLSLFTFLSAYFCLLVWLLFGLTLV